MTKHHLSTFRKYALQAVLLLAFLLSAHGLQAQLDPANNNPMPKHIAVDIADLIVLEDPAVVPTDESPQYDNGSGSFDNSLSGETWVGIKCDESATHNWTVTGNKQDGLTAFSNGERTTKSQSNATNEKIMMRSTASASGDSIIQTALDVYAMVALVPIVFGVGIGAGGIVAAGAALVGASTPVVVIAGVVAGVVADVELVKQHFFRKIEKRGMKKLKVML